MIKGVIFDCFGVLYGRSYPMLLEMCPAEHREELIDLNKENDHGYISAEDYAIGVASLIGRTADEVKDIFTQRHIRNQRMVEYVKALRVRGLKTALLTNAGRDMPGALFTHEELEGGLFDAYVVSSLDNVVKPGVEAYELIASKLDLTPGECVMVDDTEANIEGADAAGMSGLWFTDTEGTITRIDALVTTE
jgi:HAD superfamily hydrolase (TIGR01509 family)